MAVSDIEDEILELVDEDDYGVWEIGWRLVSAHRIDPEEMPRKAAEAIRSLQQRGLVNIYVREWTDDAPRPVRASGLLVDLDAPSAWREPKPGEPQLRIGAVGDDAEVDDG